jgi:hypothetical protein
MSNPMNETIDARIAAERVVHKERNRIRKWAVLSIGLWVLAGLLIPSVYLPIGAKLKEYGKLIDQANPGAADPILHDGAIAPLMPLPTQQELPDLVARLRHQQWITSQIIVHEWIVGAIILTFALGAALLASASTVALALTIRRVTLRQVSANLAEISEQLRRLQSHSA